MLSGVCQAKRELPGEYVRGIHCNKDNLDIERNAIQTKKTSVLQVIIRVKKMFLIPYKGGVVKVLERRQLPHTRNAKP